MVPFKVRNNDMGDRSHIVLTTERGNSFIGKITVEKNSDMQSSVWSLEVRYPFEGQGFGTYLLEKAEEIAKVKHESKTIYLYCYSHRLSFYFDRGYAATHKGRSGDMIKYDMLKVLEES